MSDETPGTRATARVFTAADEWPDFDPGTVVAVHLGDYRRQERPNPRSIAADSAFRVRVAGLGGEVLEPTWLGSTRPHRVRCSAGHESRPAPGNVARGQGICGRCARNDPAQAEGEFRDRIQRAGGIVVDQPWLGVDRPHRVVCSSGHEAMVRPYHVTRSQDICRTCAGNDPVASEARFHARVQELGGAVLEPAWLGAGRPHRIRCARGHVTSPRPDHVAQGTGICRACAGRKWDAFYVVGDSDTTYLKFGITSGNPKPRLADHAKNGYRHVLAMFTSLPDGMARGMERAVLGALAKHGQRPVRGREYFAIDSQPVLWGTISAYAAGWAEGRRHLYEQIDGLREEGPSALPAPPVGEGDRG